MSSNLGRHDHDTVEKSSICTLRALTVHENKKQRSQIVHSVCCPFPATFAYKYLTFLPEQNKYLNDFDSNFGISVMFHKSKSKTKTPENFIFNLLITLSFPLWYHIFTVR